MIKCKTDFSSDKYIHRHVPQYVNTIRVKLKLTFMKV